MNIRLNSFPPWRPGRRILQKSITFFKCSEGGEESKGKDALRVVSKKSTLSAGGWSLRSYPIKSESPFYGLFSRLKFFEGVLVLGLLMLSGCYDTHKKLLGSHSFDDRYTAKKSHDAAVRSQNSPGKAADANKPHTSIGREHFIQVPDQNVIFREDS